MIAISPIPRRLVFVIVFIFLLNFLLVIYRIRFNNRAVSPQIGSNSSHPSSERISVFSGSSDREREKERERGRERQRDGQNSGAVKKNAPSAIQSHDVVNTVGKTDSSGKPELGKPNLRKSVTEKADTITSVAGIRRNGNLNPGEPNLGKSDPGKPDPNKSDPGKYKQENPKPGTQNPGNANPGNPDPGKTNAGASDRTKPAAGKPDIGKPDQQKNEEKPDPGKLDFGKPDAGKPSAGKPDAGKPDAGKPDAGKPDVGIPGRGKLDAGKPDAGKPDAGKPGLTNPPGTGVGLVGDTPRAHVVPPWTRSNATVLCPLFPPGLLGNLTIPREAPKSLAQIAELNPNLEHGGHYRPSECQALHHVAIIIPYRHREEHLRHLLFNLHPVLQRQQLDYFILIVEMTEPTPFNRGMLMNVGVVEALGMWDVQCFIFHDVDLIPENDWNLYACPTQPRHMSAAIDKFKYKLLYTQAFGGVSALNREQFWKVNGFPNRYFGWGGEDDDLSRRCTGMGLKLTRYPLQIARYHMIKHGHDPNNKINAYRFATLNKWKQYQRVDGLNSLQYRVVDVKFQKLYTWILVTIDQDTIVQKFPELKNSTQTPHQNVRRV